MKEVFDFFRKYHSNREVFHDLMPLRMREILLVATVYDAFSLEHDTPLTEVIFEDYNQLNLANAPRITSVASDDDAAQKLQSRRFDLVIVLSRVHRIDWRTFTRRMRLIDPQIPILLLLHDNTEIEGLAQNQPLRECFDNIFVWNGNSEIFLAMVKCTEDRFNAENDSHIGLVRVILLVEDSVRYYSRYLPLLYREIVKQTHRLMVEEHHDDMQKVLRLRARPKVLLASTYEDAMRIYNQYRDSLLCVISDVAYPRGGAIDDEAGVKLIQELRLTSPDLPVVLQSSNSDNARLAKANGAVFVNKNSESLTHDLADFFYHSLGFGDFVFRDNAGAEVARARTLTDLMDVLNLIPAESVVYHASRNHFSAWLMARGEIQIAQMVFKAKVDDFANPEDLRSFLLDVGEHVLNLKITGRVIPFDESYLGEDGAQSIVRLAEGSLGGKGRGVAFVNSFLQNARLSEQFPEVDIRIPQTSVIGVIEFSTFIESNRLARLVTETHDHDVVKRRFLAAKLAPGLVDRLRRFLDQVHHPLAIRSSGLLEDSLSHPLSGLYETFFLPNNHPDPAARLEHLLSAIKLIYASVYSRNARAYFEAIGYKIEEERMAVVIQEVVGSRHGNRFYPHFSGVAQSYNFYPYSHIEPEDGVAMVALGLGRYVVGGEPAYRFCPAWPELDINTMQEQMRSAQQHFYALDLSSSNADLFDSDGATLAKFTLKDAENDGTLEQLVSVYDVAEDRFRVGLDGKGPRVVNLTNILKYNSFPLARILQVILGVVKDAMETPVEIEFAVNLDAGRSGKPTFYLLQVKHRLRKEEECTLKLEEIKENQLFLFANKCMGNGLEASLHDVIWVDPTGFDKSRTLEMAAEIDALNEELKHEGRKYILMGPGRWGTRDRWLGIPIAWPQISSAKVIVEYSLEDFRVDASLGSHFFHNVTSMNIGYFTVPCNLPPSFIGWEWLRAQPVRKRTRHFVHTRLDHPLPVVMDGRKGVGVIYKGSLPD